VGKLFVPTAGWTIARTGGCPFPAGYNARKLKCSSQLSGRRYSRKKNGRRQSSSRKIGNKKITGTLVYQIFKHPEFSLTSEAGIKR
jgi:hypothetical protein